MFKRQRRSRREYPVLLRPGMRAYVYENLGHVVIFTDIQHYFGLPSRRPGVPVTWNDLVDLLSDMAREQGLEVVETGTCKVFEFQRKDRHE